MPSITVTIPHISFFNTVTELYFVKYFPVQYHHQNINAFHYRHYTSYFVFLYSHQTIFCQVFSSDVSLLEVQYNTVTQNINDFNYRHNSSYFVLQYSHQTIFYKVISGDVSFLKYSTIPSPET